MQTVLATRMAVSIFAAIAIPAWAQPSVTPKAVPEEPAITPTEDDILRRQLDDPGGPDGPGFDLDWFTVDGGGATYLTGGVFELGATAGQPDAGSMSGGTFTLAGGFWPAVVAPTCYANCDQSTGNPRLTGNDFQCFINAFATSNPYANCDGSTGTPLLTGNDFLCFINAYANGCS